MTSFTPIRNETTIEGHFVKPVLITGEEMHMKKRDLYETYDIHESCAYCEHASPLSDHQEFLCRYKGVVQASYRCKKFTYDLLKRVPSPRILSIPSLSLDEEHNDGGTGSAEIKKES